MAKKQSKPDGLPVCVALVLCSQVVTGQDGTSTLVRIIDTIGVDASKNDLKAGEGMELNDVRLFISMKNGNAKKEYDLVLSVVDPKGKKSKVGHASVTPVGNVEAGQNVITPLRIKWDGEGVYWIELSIGESLIAKSPIRLVIASPENFPKKMADLKKKKQDGEK